MGIKRWLIGAGIGLGLLAGSLFTPMIPSKVPVENYVRTHGVYTLTSSEGGKNCTLEDKQKTVGHETRLLSPNSYVRELLKRKDTTGISTTGINHTSTSGELDPRVVYIDEGTGYLIARDLVLTAAHVVLDRNSGYKRDKGEHVIIMPVSEDYANKKYEELKLYSGSTLLLNSKSWSTTSENDPKVSGPKVKRTMRWISEVPENGEEKGVWNYVEGKVERTNPDKDLAIVRLSQPFSASAQVGNPTTFNTNGLADDADVYIRTTRSNPVHGKVYRGSWILSDRSDTDKPWQVYNGDSGSSVLDKDGRIVGVVNGSNQTRHEYTGGGMPTEKSISEYALGPMAPAIIELLQGYCNEPKGSEVQFPGNSREQQFYNQHGYTRTPPKNLGVKRR